jgi:hypothetical protein
VAETIEVSVEQRHIDRGIRNSDSRCPLALALSEQHPGRYWRVFFDSVYAWLWGPDTHLPGPGTRCFSMPPAVLSWTRAFDGGDTVTPFRTTLRQEL